jgi:hypothetical protein
MGHGQDVDGLLWLKAHRSSLRFAMLIEIDTVYGVRNTKFELLAFTTAWSSGKLITKYV